MERGKAPGRQAGAPESAGKYPYVVVGVGHAFRPLHLRFSVHIRGRCVSPALVLDPAEIEAESTRLSSCIEDTSIAIFDQRKEYSPRGACWWNNDCQQAVREVRNAANTETRKAAQKTLRSTIRPAKKDWANNLLHNATTESLWKAARWRHGR
jgi:hypothetical protein